jgi:hypothetical protein
MVQKMQDQNTEGGFHRQQFLSKSLNQQQCTAKEIK